MTQPRYIVPIGVARCPVCNAWTCYGRDHVRAASGKKFSFIKCTCGQCVVVPPLKPESQPTP